MILIENVICNSKRELEQIERKYMDELKPSLNTNNSYRTKDDLKNYYEEKKEHKKSYDKIYRQNKKDKISEFKKKYYEDNKTEILQKQKEKINCEFCNSLITKIQLKRHQHTTKCKKFQFIED